MLRLFVSFEGCVLTGHPSRDLQALFVGWKLIPTTPGSFAAADMYLLSDGKPEKDPEQGQTTL